MRKTKFLSSAAALALLLGTAYGASAATSDITVDRLQLAQTSSDSDAGATGGGASDTGPQTDVTEPSSDVTPDVTNDSGTTTDPNTATGQMGSDSGATTMHSEAELAARADEIIGQPVVNQQGEEIGDIEDLVVDTSDKVHAVVGVGGFLGIGERQVAIPAENLQFGQEQALYTGMGTTEDLEAMPEYNSEGWRSLSE